MNEADFNKLNGLLSKLENATNKAAKEDGCFRKYHTGSISSIKAIRANLEMIQHGLRTASITDERQARKAEIARNEYEAGNTKNTKSEQQASRTEA
jgi:hypothetical protein